MATVTITYNGNELVIQGSTVGKRVKEALLRRSLRVDELIDPVYREVAFYAIIYLSHIKDGSIGFDIPKQDDNLETVTIFLDRFMELDDSLLSGIDDAVMRTRTITNEPDLLPPEAVPSSKKKNGASKKSA